MSNNRLRKRIRRNSDLANCMRAVPVEIDGYYFKMPQLMREFVEDAKFHPDLDGEIRMRLSDKNSLLAAKDTYLKFQSVITAWDLVQPEAQDFFCDRNCRCVLIIATADENTDRAALNYYNALPEQMDADQ